MWVSLGLGSTGGYLLGKALGEISLSNIGLVIVTALAIFMVSSYFTAPIRDA